MRKVAIVGATGAVGRALIEILLERKFPIEELICYSSKKGAGTKVKFNRKIVKAIELKKSYKIKKQKFARTHNPLVKAHATLSAGPFDGCDLVFFTSSSAVSEEYVPLAIDAGAWVIDNSSHYRLQADVPLVIPEINGHEINPSTKLLANPNCTTAQMVMALKPVSDAFGLERVILSSYQAVSGRGKKGVDEFKALAQKLVKTKWKNAQNNRVETKEFPHPIAFNCIPQVDVFMADGFTGEEHKVMAETKKILNLPHLRIVAHCVRVPVLNGHSEMVSIETHESCTVEEVRNVLSKFPGVRVLDDPAKGVYPLATLASGKDEVLVGRIRKDPSLTERDNGIILWIVADNLRKGAALNAVQIAEQLK